MTANILTQDRLRELLYYNKQFGIFVWIQKIGRIEDGDLAGWIGSDGYISMRVDGGKYLSHRLAVLYMTGAFPPAQGDHINGVTSDNRWVNIRSVTHQENSKNRKAPSTNTSGVMGVSWNKASKKWRAYIGAENSNVNLGFFNGFFDACCARKSAEIKYNYHPNHGRR